MPWCHRLFFHGGAESYLHRCQVALPSEDGHHMCVQCLGCEHALLARENPHSCMDCFIMLAHTREAFLKETKNVRVLLCLRLPLACCPISVQRLQQAQERHQCVQEVSGSLHLFVRSAGCPSVSLPRLTPETEAWGPGDVRHQLETFHKHAGRWQGGRRLPAQAPGPSWKPHTQTTCGPPTNPQRKSVAGGSGTPVATGPALRLSPIHTHQLLLHRVCVEGAQITLVVPYWPHMTLFFNDPTNPEHPSSPSWQGSGWWPGPMKGWGLGSLGGCC